MIYTDKVFEDDALELLPAYLILAEANICLGPTRLKKAEEFLIAAYWNLLKNSSDDAKANDMSLVTKEDIKRRAEKKQKGQPLTEDVENSLPDWEDDPVMKSKLKCNGEKLAEYRRREPIPTPPLCARRLLF